MTHTTIVMWKKGKPHNLGRTNIIYWPTQILMLGSAAALAARAAVLKSNGNSYAPATMFSTITMMLAWVSDDRYHEQYIATSSSYQSKKKIPGLTTVPSLLFLNPHSCRQSD